MSKNSLVIAFLFAFIGIKAQNSERIKIDGVSVVVGENIVLDSDIDKFKKELAQRTEGKVDISDCEILEEIMTQKLLAHHAVVDSIVVSDAEVESEVERNISYFKQQLGSLEKVVDYYGFSDEEDLRNELGSIQREQLLIQRERASLTENVDVTPEEVRTYFKNLEVDNNLPEFSAEIELAQIVKILKPSEEETKRVLDKLNELKKDIENGYSFRLKAIINSDDPGVSQNGGLYTLTRESGFIKEFKEIAFSLDEGEISEPFESGFGFHILQVEKIKGQERDVRHILIQPKISDEELAKSLEELAKIRTQILNNEISFEDAVAKYSEDKDTKNNKGLLLNSQTNDTHFDLTRMDPNLFNKVSSLKQGEITEPFYEDVRGGEKMHKIILVKSKVDGHKAEFTKDYEKIQQLTLQKKQEETVEKWSKDKINDTYIKINKDYKKCTFDKNWKKD
ncbi:peptidylprolyl isomerase [Lutibacter sp. TH_r2]|uniref:peptidylprolyl isomerase n=1 Tax=Lutibacter sp. TH_r2 TaxID=3082083 RepID=UPI00295376FA|nr:peptidylprolyl isomerase [Lutibacter sp. TH_r2]MDV7188431.1 peptidylprolyl isomerase [Lutibacter sp. TH_r2]